MRRPQNLESLAVTAYLDYLEREVRACLAIRRLGSSSNGGVVCDRLADATMDRLREQLAQHVGSHAVRQKFLEELLSGYRRYPSGKQKADPGRPHVQDVDGEDVYVETLFPASMAKRHWRRCLCLCCSDPFVPEEMIKVIVTEDTQALEFSMSASGNTKRLGLPEESVLSLSSVTRGFPQFSGSTVLGAVVKAAEDAARRRKTCGEEQKPYALKKLKATPTGSSIWYGRKDFNMQIARANHDFDFYFSYSAKNRDCDVYVYPDEGYLMGHQLTRLLSAAVVSHGGFARLSDIDVSLGIHYFTQESACSFVKAVGQACPRLKKMWLTTEVVLHLLVKDPLVSLHTYTYNYERRHQEVEGGWCDWEVVEDSVEKHRDDAYCPMCRDEWYEGEIRTDCKDLPEPVYVVADKVLDVLEVHADEETLVNCVRASDVYNMPGSDPFYLVRPSGVHPTREDFRLPEGTRHCREDNGGGDVRDVFMPDECRYERRRRPGQNVLSDLHPLVETLEDLLLPIFACPLLVPFILRYLPRIRNLGSARLTEALRLATKHTSTPDKFPGLLENTYPRITNFELWLDTVPNLDNQFDTWGRLVKDMERIFHPESDTYVEARAAIGFVVSGPMEDVGQVDEDEDDVVLHSRQTEAHVRRHTEMASALFPNINRVVLKGFNRDDFPLVRPECWNALVLLPNFTHLVVDTKSPSILDSLLAAPGLGAKLKNIKITNYEPSLDSSGLEKGFCLDFILSACPKLEELDLDQFPVVQLDPDRASDLSAAVMPPGLRRFRAPQSGMTWRLLFALLRHCPELTSVQCERIYRRERDFPSRWDLYTHPGEEYEAGRLFHFDDDDVRRLLAPPGGPPAQLETLKIDLMDTPISPRALLKLLSALPAAREVHNFTVRTTHTDDDAARAVDDMIEWKRYYVDRCSRDPGFRCRWTWEKEGGVAVPQAVQEEARNWARAAPDDDRIEVEGEERDAHHFLFDYKMAKDRHGGIFSLS